MIDATLFQTPLRLANLPTDQRGGGFARVAGSAADIGAFEIQAAPRVSSTQVNDGAAQRSRLSSLTVTFTSTAEAAFTLVRNSDAVPVAFSATASLVGGVTFVTINNFGGAATQFLSLADGRYTLTALASQISAGGQALDGNGDGVPGDNYTFGESQGLFRFYGDVNGDQTVNGLDFGFFKNAFGTQVGDANYPGLACCPLTEMRMTPSGFTSVDIYRVIRNRLLQKRVFPEHAMQKTFENSDDPSMKRFAVKGPVESTGGLAGLAAPVMGTRWRGGFERILICPA